jgi:hypothetical protein
MTDAELHDLKRRALAHILWLALFAALLTLHGLALWPFTRRVRR